MLRPLLAVLLLAVAVPAAAQTPSAQAPPAPGASCRTAEHGQFDFWVGRWDVRTPDGTLAGTNVIERVLDGCALRETWTGTGGGRGLSLSYYDRATRRWYQTWVDNQGPPLRLEGARRAGRMVLETDAPGPDGRVARQRITWAPLPGGGVRQHWEVSSDEGTTWTTVFDGRYMRSSSP